MSNCLACGHDRSVHQPGEFGACMDYVSRCKCEAYIVSGCPDCAALREENATLNTLAHSNMALAKMGDAEAERLREAVEWACENMTRMEPEDVQPFLDELRRRAGKEGG